MKYLFKVTLTAAIWYRGGKLKPVYVVASDKESAHEMVSRSLSSPDLSVKTVSLLARELSGVMFSANY